MEAEHEELGSNPFWIALQRETKLMTQIGQEGAIVCVPASESLKLCKLSSDFLSTHILTLSPHFADTYMTRNGKTCTFKDGRVICRTGFPRPRTVMVVYEELFYDDDFNSIKILRTNFPLEGKIPMNYYKSVASQASVDVASLNARTLPEHQIVLCKLSGPQYSTLTTSSFSPEQALANIGASPSPHLTPLSTLPPIFLSLQKFIFSFNTSYVLVKGFVEHAGTKVKDACERMKLELCGKPDEHGSNGKSSNGKDSTSSSSSATSTAAPKMTRMTSMEASAAIEACIFAGIHRKLFHGLIELNKLEEQRTQTYLTSCLHITMAELGVRPELICDPTNAIQHLQQAINGPFAITPLQKLSVLEDTNRLLTQAVDAQLAASRSQHTAATASDPGAPPCDELKQDVTLAADDMLPFWIYLLIQARFHHIHANLNYLEHFQPNNPFINVQQLKVHLANLQGAVQYVDSGKLSSTPPGTTTPFHDSSALPTPIGTKRRTASTIVSSSFVDLSLRDNGPTTNGLPSSSRKSHPTSSNGLTPSINRATSQQLLDAISDDYEELVASQQLRSTNGQSSSHHVRTGSSSDQLPARPTTQRTASISYPMQSPSLSQLPVRSTGPASSSTSTSVAPHLVRMSDVPTTSSASNSNRSSRDRDSMGDFLSNLQRQDDIVTGRLEKGQTLLGVASHTHGDGKSSTWQPTPVPVQRRPSTINSVTNVLQLDDADLPPLIVQRTTPATQTKRY